MNVSCFQFQICAWFEPKIYSDFRLRGNADGKLAEECRNEVLLIWISLCFDHWNFDARYLISLSTIQKPVVYPCMFCRSKFKTENYLKLHISRRHPQNPQTNTENKVSYYTANGFSLRVDWCRYFWWYTEYRCCQRFVICCWNIQSRKSHKRE